MITKISQSTQSNNITYYINDCNTEIEFNRTIKPSLQTWTFPMDHLQNRDVSLRMLLELDSELLLFIYIQASPSSSVS
jgi:hypothetical protein